MKTKLITLLALLMFGAVTHGADFDLDWKWVGVEADLAGYRLLIDKQTDGVFEETKDQTERVNGVVLKRIRVTIPDGQTHAFKVVAVFKDGTVSEPSNRLVVQAPAPKPKPTELSAEQVKPQ